MVFILLRKNLIRLITRAMCLTTDDQGTVCLVLETENKEKKTYEIILFAGL